MAGCTCENWTLQDLSSALQDMHKDNKRIVVPMFQRGQRWSKDQEKIFIDSLINLSVTTVIDFEYSGCCLITSRSISGFLSLLNTSI